MEISQFAAGESGLIVSYACIATILTLLLIVTLKLWISRRKKAYFSLAVSVTIVIAHYVLMGAYEIVGHAGIRSEWMQLMNAIAFIIMNTGIYQLYNVTRRREILFMTVLIAGAAAIALIPEQDMWLGLYALLLVVLGYVLIAPQIGGKRTYRIALLLWAVTILAGLFNRTFPEKHVLALQLVESYLPIGFYILLFIMVFNRVIELMQAIYHTSMRDGLTGLYNRHFFYRRVAEHVRLGERIAVLFCDIDNFKKLNDTEGHQTGDNVLRQVASIVQEQCEDAGIAGRYGGEEIVVLLTDPDTAPEDFAERIRSRVEEETGVTVSIGYSVLNEGISARELIVQADEAMYAAKRTGKNKVVAYQ